MAGQKFPDWDRNTRMPVPAPPAGSCDCQFHIFDDVTKYPPKKDAYYQPLPGCTFGHARGMLEAMGFSRGVIVHAMPYDTDHSLLIDTLEGLSPELKANTRATCIVKDNVTDATMERLHKAGVHQVITTQAPVNTGRLPCTDVEVVLAPLPAEAARALLLGDRQQLNKKQADKIAKDCAHTALMLQMLGSFLQQDRCSAQVG